MVLCFVFCLYFICVLGFEGARALIAGVIAVVAKTGTAAAGGAIGMTAIDGLLAARAAGRGRGRGRGTPEGTALCARGYR